MTALESKVAIVTGGSSGIGAATAMLLAERGVRVVVCGSRPETAAPVVDAIRTAGGEAVAATGDVAAEDTAQAAVTAALDSFGRLDILVNNAAVTSAAFLVRDTNVVEMEAEVWTRTLAVNLIGPALFCKHAIPAMIKGGGGSIIMVSSGRGVQGDLALAAYGASKAALINLALNVATQYGKQGVRANSVVVGMVMTPSVEAVTTPEIRALLRSHHLTPEIGAPRDVAEAIAFLASDSARFITGATLAADGGITCHTAPYADFAGMGGEGMVAAAS